MKLTDLFCNVTTASELPNIDVTALCRDSRKVEAGCLFVCIRGTGVDSHTFAAEVLQNGAAAVVVDHDMGLDRQIVVEDTRLAWALLSATWFGNPSKRIKLVGITGTNGKTSSTHLLKAILEHAGYTVGLIGTIENKIGDRVIEAGHTTPDAYDLQRLLCDMADAGCTHVVMEVSSHALDQDRVGGCHFAVGGFTNLTQDHLDYHGTMENYAGAKRKLFFMCDKAVINLDDAASAFMINGVPAECTTYSTHDNYADYTARNIRQKPDGVEFELVGIANIGRISLSTPGAFSVYNALTAATAALALDVAFDTVIEGLCQTKTVKGRAEVVENTGDFTVVIDYAHTPDGLQNICETLNACKTGRLITVFGCGGDRDKTKRPLMGAVAASLSDYVVVTSDNPRTENPEAIIQDILPGMADKTTPYTVLCDRTEAIRFALHEAKAGDTVLLAGKGHETYQILANETIHYDEREIIAEILSQE